MPTPGPRFRPPSSKEVRLRAARGPPPAVLPPPYTRAPSFPARALHALLSPGSRAGSSRSWPAAPAGDPWRGASKTSPVKITTPLIDPVGCLPSQGAGSRVAGRSPPLQRYRGASASNIIPYVRQTRRSIPGNQRQGPHLPRGHFHRWGSDEDYAQHGHRRCPRRSARRPPAPGGQNILLASQLKTGWDLKLG